MFAFLALAVTVMQFQNIIDQLDAIAEQLSDLAFESLKTAVRTNDLQIQNQEKKIRRALRNVEKAAAILKPETQDDF